MRRATQAEIQTEILEVLALGGRMAYDAIEEQVVKRLYEKRLWTPEMNAPSARE